MLVMLVSSTKQLARDRKLWLQMVQRRRLRRLTDVRRPSHVTCNILTCNPQLHALLEEVDDEFHEELKAPCHMVEVLQAEPNVTNTWTFAPTVIFCLTVVTTIG